MQGRQFGVGVLGGCEGLVHFKLQLEESLKRDAGAALVILHLDLKNAFPSFEWDHIRVAVATHAKGVDSWTRWCHAEEHFVILPCGRVIRRGAR